jgi:hypothetical protein
MRLLRTGREGGRGTRRLLLRPPSFRRERP